MVLRFTPPTKTEWDDDWRALYLHRACYMRQSRACTSPSRLRTSLVAFPSRCIDPGIHSTHQGTIPTINIVLRVSRTTLVTRPHQKPSESEVLYVVYNRSSECRRGHRGWWISTCAGAQVDMLMASAQGSDGVVSESSCTWTCCPMPIVAGGGGS